MVKIRFILLAFKAILTGKQFMLLVSGRNSTEAEISASEKTIAEVLFISANENDTFRKCLLIAANQFYKDDE